MSSIGERSKPWIMNPNPLETLNRDATLTDLGTSTNAVSFGFLATAIFISMFLLMAIFEHLRPSSFFPWFWSRYDNRRRQAQAQMHLSGKLGNLQTVETPYQSGFSVLMPGQKNPTYIAKPAPLPCPREGIHWPLHGHYTFAAK